MDQKPTEVSWQKVYGVKILHNQFLSCLLESTITQKEINVQVILKGSRDPMWTLDLPGGGRGPLHSNGQIKYSI